MNLAYDLAAYDLRTSNFAPKPALAELVGGAKGELAFDEEAAVGIIYAPKPNGMMRPGSQVSVPTSLKACKALVDCMPRFRQLEESTNGIQFANRLRPEDKKVRQKGIHSSYGWEKLHKELNASGSKVVGVADVQGFYERITGSILERELDRHNFPLTAIDAFCEFAEASGCGLPQGSSVSDTLAMFILQPLLSLANRFADVRAFSDDIRVLGDCRLATAERLSVVSRIFADHGFSFGSSKYHVYDGKQAEFALRGLVPDKVNVEFYFGDHQAEMHERDALSRSPYGKGERSTSGLAVLNFEKYAEDRFLTRSITGSSHLDKWVVRNGCCDLPGVIDSIRKSDHWLLPQAIGVLGSEARAQMTHEVVSCERTDDFTKSAALLNANRKLDVSVGNACIGVLRDRTSAGYLTTAAAIASAASRNPQIGMDALVAFGRATDLGTAVELIRCASIHLPKEDHSLALRIFADRSEVCRAAALKFLAA